MYEQHIQLLNKIRNRLSNVGWRRGTQSQSIDYDKPCCLLDTMDAVGKFESTDVWKIINEVQNTLRHIVSVEDTNNRFSFMPGDPNSEVNMVSWNDWKHRKFKDVLNLIDQGLSYYYTESESLK